VREEVVAARQAHLVSVVVTPSTRSGIAPFHVIDVWAAAEPRGLGGAVGRSRRRRRHRALSGIRVAPPAE